MPHLPRHGTSVFKVISERPVILTSKLSSWRRSNHYLYSRLSFDAVVRRTRSSNARPPDHEARVLPSVVVIAHLVLTGGQSIDHLKVRGLVIIKRIIE